MLMSTPSARDRARGFSLIEVMVALVIAGVGLLGLAKMEAVALSSTGVAAHRSLAAIQASSIAAAMHANRDFWTVPLAADIIITNASNPYANVHACTAAPCVPVDIANYDLSQWASDLYALLPGYTGTISCPKPPVGSIVVSCAIKISWMEGKVAADNNQIMTGPATSLNTPDYTLYVQP